jgi:hypothetical protein
LWRRAEDDLLVPAVAKDSTSDVLGRDWSDVALELPGRLPQQWKERYRLADTVAALTLVFLRISVGRVRCAPACVSTDSRSKGIDIAYTSTPSPSSLSTVPSAPSPPSSLTHVHRHIGSRMATRQTLPTSAKLTYLSVYDSRDGVPEHVASPSPPSSLMHVHRCIGSRNATRQTLPTSAKLTYQSVYDSINGTSQCMRVV